MGLSNRLDLSTACPVTEVALERFCCSLWSVSLLVEVAVDLALQMAVSGALVAAPPERHMDLSVRSLRRDLSKQRRMDSSAIEGEKRHTD